MKNNKRNLRLGILWADPYAGNLGVAALSIRRSFCSRRYRAGPASGSITRCGERAARSRHCSTRDGNGFRSGPYGRFWAAIFPHSQRDVSPTRSGSGRRCSHSIFCGMIWSPTSGPATVIRTFTASPASGIWTSPNRGRDGCAGNTFCCRRRSGLTPSEEARRKAAGR